MNFYGPRQLIDGMRTVRRKTIQAVRRTAEVSP